MSKTKITRKLEKLTELLDQIQEASVINSNDPETWDSDALYDLAENCKALLKLLEDKEHPQEKDEFGNPLILEAGLLSLVDEYWDKKDETEDF